MLQQSFKSAAEFRSSIVRSLGRGFSTKPTKELTSPVEAKRNELQPLYDDLQELSKEEKDDSNVNNARSLINNSLKAPVVYKPSLLKESNLQWKRFCYKHPHRKFRVEDVQKKLQTLSLELMDSSPPEALLKAIGNDLCQILLREKGCIGQVPDSTVAEPH